MTARADILTFKHDIPKLKAEAAIARTLADKLFENFVAYAAANWDYAAQPGGQTADSALSGTGRKALACGTIREALKKMFREDIGCADAKNADLNEYFITKPDLKCFDPKVKGNLGNRGSATFNLGCHFSSHFFLESGGKFYDACLSTTYASATGPIFHKTRQVGTLTETVPGLRFAGVGKSTIVLRLIPGRAVPGFGSVWEILTLDETKRLLNGTDLKRFKATPALQGLV